MAIRGSMREECLGHLDGSQLSPVRRAVARGLVRVRCAGLFRRLDEATGRVASRVLARAFTRLVALPRAQCRWRGAPLPVSDGGGQPGTPGAPLTETACPTS